MKLLQSVTLLRELSMHFAVSKVASYCIISDHTRKKGWWVGTQFLGRILSLWIDLLRMTPQDGPPTHVIGLLPGLLVRDLSATEIPSMVRTFKNEFAIIDCDYPSKNFWMSSWIHYGKRDWWAILIGFILAKCKDHLKKIWLHEAIRAIQYGIDTNMTQFFPTLEVYCPWQGILYTQQWAWYSPHKMHNWISDG